MSSSEFLVIVALCFMGYGLYRIFNYSKTREAANNNRKTQRQNEVQESLANISDKNLAIVLTYIYEQQKYMLDQQKKDIKAIKILAFILILILTNHRN